MTNQKNGNSKNGNSPNGNPVETEELSAEDYAIIAAGLTALGDLFAFLSLVKAREVTKTTGGEAGGGMNPVVFLRSNKKSRH
ncbi:hypothetical protein [Paenibacillus sp. sgz500958]|uniref:hypothetical protein n=1 Tax=Paenibacillus sp. sgz500958 TaxID=3242475 RepID=UPI0036D37550